MSDSPRVNRARELRQKLNKAELVLWRQLRDRRFAKFKFRRQTPIGPYVVDFFCHAQSLIVELDGESHFGREHGDQLREQNLEACGYRVIRFTNEQVYEDLDTVLDVIYRCLVGAAS